METKDIIILVFAFFGAVGGVAGAWATIKGIGPKNRVDESTASKNFQEIIVKMQDADARAQVRENEHRAEIAALNAKIDGRVLSFDQHIEIEIDKAPIVTIGEYKWTNRGVPTIPAPKRNTGFGVRQ